jgi:O-antigen ligase
MKIKILNADAGIVSGQKERWLILLTGIFICTFFLPGAPVINNLAILALVLYTLFYNRLSEKRQLFKERPAIIFIVIFYLLHIASVFVTKDTTRGLLYLQVRTPLILFPISIGLIYIRDAVKIRIYLLYAVVVTLVAAFCLITALLVYARTGDSGFIYNDSLTDAIGKQSSYFALIVNIALFSYGYLLIRKLVTVKARLPVYLATGFLMIIQFMLASRMEIILLYGSATIFALYYFFVKTQNRKAGFVTLGALAICAVSFVLLFPKTINRFNELLYPSYDFKSDAVESHYNMQLTADQWNGLNIRLAIWNCGFEVIKRHPITGVSLGDKDQALLDVFKEKGFQFGIRTNKNMHSTYLDVLASLGIIGLTTFLLGFVILPLADCIKLKDVIGSIVLIDFMLSFVSETYPDRSMGCIIFGFFISFIISYKKKLHREIAM